MMVLTIRDGFAHLKKGKTRSMMAIANNGRKGKKSKKVTRTMSFHVGHSLFPFFSISLNFPFRYQEEELLMSQRTPKPAQSILKSVLKVPLDHTKYFFSKAY
ncbi:hypothetical protein EUGRSUZ_G01394 [Eucalyptus grandis]|uniref:Uncharacterized protein n=2 Tax=Eucalyptus grandis TaxID=71139 RepID=A0ACC3K2F4_EUCGR|nr:hypothetical protein EUGRSUZ_G01394 [Eucalyptus grandis]